MKTRLSGIASASVVLFVALSACAGVETDRALEVLDYRVNQGQLEITVITTGCTKKSDFDFDVKRNAGDGDTTVLIIRKRPDNCKKMPSAKTLTYALNELGLTDEEEIRILNPVTSLKPVSRS